MKTTQDLPIDGLGQLGKAIRPEPAKPVDTIKPFEAGNHGRDGSLIGNVKEAAKSIADTLRKKSPKDEAPELPRITWAWTRIHRQTSLNEWADRWHFEGGAEEGYESPEAAEDAREAMVFCNHRGALYVASGQTVRLFIPGGDFAGLAELNAWIEAELQKLCGIPARGVRLLDGESEA